MKRFEVWLARLDPGEGSEMSKTRPVVILSPDVMNARLHTALAAPLILIGWKLIRSIYVVLYQSLLALAPEQA